MANKNTNPGSGKDDNEMRIQFGLILALCQNCVILHNPLFHAQNSNLFKGLSPMFHTSTINRNENMVWTDSQDYGSTMYLSTENVKKSLLWLSPPVLKWFLTETDLSTLLRG